MALIHNLQPTWIVLAFNLLTNIQHYFNFGHLSASWYFRLNFALYSCSQATPIMPAFRRHRCSPLSTLIHSPDSTTERSPSLLPHVRRFSEDRSVNQAKRRKEDNEPEVQEENKEGEQEGVDKQDDKHERIKRTATDVSSQSFKEEPVDKCSTIFRPNLIWLP